MKWTLKGDNTAPVITAEKHVSSRHSHGAICRLPETCVIFELGMALRFIESNYPTATLIERLPCFLEDSRCIAINGGDGVCFTRGGYGAPAAVDTLETLRALGVKRVIVAGMCGGFAEGIGVCDVLIPRRLLCEEGTSNHYYEDIEFIEPDEACFSDAKAFFARSFTVDTGAVVTCDALYRETFAKEAFWRANGCVGVDMESSALLSVSRYYAMPAVSILLCSDKHPAAEGDPAWDWGSERFQKTREEFVRQVVAFALRQ